MSVQRGRRGLLPVAAGGALRLDTDWQSVINCCQFCTAYDEVGYKPLANQRIGGDPLPGLGVLK